MQTKAKYVENQMLTHHDASDSNPEQILKRTVTKQNLKSDKNVDKKLESITFKMATSQLSNSNKLDRKSNPVVAKEWTISDFEVGKLLG